MNPFIEVQFLDFSKLIFKVPWLWAPLSWGVGLEINLRLHLNFSRNPHLRMKREEDLI